MLKTRKRVSVCSIEILTLDCHNLQDNRYTYQRQTNQKVFVH